MKCDFKKEDGSSCNAYSTKDSSYCYRHNPDNKKDNLLASIKGGQNRALKGPWGQNIRLNSPKDVRVFLGQVINKVWTGEVPVPVGSSMGFLTRCWMDAYEVSELESRIKNIETKLKNSNL